MLKLHQIFLLNLFVILAILFTVVLSVSYYTASDFEKSHAQSSVNRDVKLINRLLENSEMLNSEAALLGYLDSARKDIYLDISVFNSKGFRVDGGDKNEKNEAITNNAVILTGTNGSVVLKDDSNGMLYGIVKIALGEENYFIKLAYPASDIKTLLGPFWYKIALAFTFCMMISLVVSYLISRRIDSQIGKIGAFLQEIEEKNFKAKIKPEFAKEFFTLSRVLQVLAVKLEKKEKQKRKYLANLRLKNRQTTEIIEAISHEFKNPVAAIMGYSETLLSEENPEPKISKRFLEKIYANANSISEMVDRLSLAVKFESGMIEPKQEKFCAFDLVEEAVSTLNHKYKERSIKVSGAKVYVVADKTMVRLVVVNLLENALKYSKEIVEVTLDSDGKDAIFEVKDSGIGISDSEIENIQKKFYRITKNNWDSSLGLGLSLVEFVLKLHGSILEIQSKVGVGSTFRFTLPLFSKQEVFDFA